LKILEQQDTGTCTKTLKIEVPRDEIGSELDGVYKEFIENAAVPGFRKGKAPRSIVKMKFGKHLDDEAVNKSLEAGFKRALEELDLKPVTDPEFSEIEKEKEDEPVSFTAKFEYAPKVDEADYKDIKLDLPEMDVTEKEVVDALNHLRESNATYSSIDDRPVGDDDYVFISSNASIDGEPFPEATHDEIVVQIGSGQYIPGFEDAVKGMKIGEKKTIQLTLPEDYPNEEKRGLEAEFEIEAKQIREKHLAELDDEFAKDMGNFDSLDELKERIRDDLARNMVQRREDQKRGAVREELLKRNIFDVPPSMVRAQYNYINAVQDMELKRQGRSLENEAKQDEGFLARNEKTAEEEVRLSMLLHKIAEGESIELAETDYYAYVARMAQQANTDPSAYLRQISSQGMEAYYKRIALEQKVMDFILSLSEKPDEKEPAEEGSNDTEEN